MKCKIRWVTEAVVLCVKRNLDTISSSTCCFACVARGSRNSAEMVKKESCSGGCFNPRYRACLQISESTYTDLCLLESLAMKASIVCGSKCVHSKLCIPPQGWARSLSFYRQWRLQQRWRPFAWFFLKNTDKHTFTCTQAKTSRAARRLLAYHQGRPYSHSHNTTENLVKRSIKKLLLFISSYRVRELKHKRLICRKPNAHGCVQNPSWFVTQWISPLLSECLFLTHKCYRLNS